MLDQRWILVAMIACGTPPAQRQVEVHREAHVLVYGAPAPVDDTGGVIVEDLPNDQPPEMKVRLGHYANRSRGIGLVIDMTRTPVRIKFDGSSPVVQLDRESGPSRVDYIRRLGDPVVRVVRGPRVYVFVDGADDPIEVRRDGDAEPL